MRELISELQGIYKEVRSFIDCLNAPEILEPLDAIEQSAIEVGKAWSRSWLGYQSSVYFHGLEAPPAGANFSSEWGFESTHSKGTSGHWEEFSEDAIKTEIRRRARNADTAKAQEASDKGRQFFEQKRDDVISILQTAKGARGDPFLDKLPEETEQIKAFSSHDFIIALRPSGQLGSRDSLAITQGLWTPPHISVLAEVAGMRAPTNTCESLARLVRRAFSHLERTEKRLAKAERIGTDVFIGHGRSKEWKELKDFISERMRLPWDEFNRIPVAGIANTVRLSTMLDAAAIAFIVLKGEDERADRTMQARMNVVHEAGLFRRKKLRAAVWSRVRLR
jgi:hypothetical protein